MGTGSGHRYIESPWSTSTPFEWVVQEPQPKGCYSTGIRGSVAERLVYLVLRESPHPDGTERGEPGPVADQRAGASVGERLPTNAELAVLREGGVPDKRRWTRLVGLDYLRALLK